jgi:hypothetical protein
MPMLQALMMPRVTNHASPCEPSPGRSGDTLVGNARMQVYLLRAWSNDLFCFAQSVLGRKETLAWGRDPLDLQVLTAVLDFLLSLQLQLWPSPGLNARVVAQPQTGWASKGPETGASSARQTLTSPADELFAANFTILCEQLSTVVEDWQGTKEALAGCFLGRGGLLLRWLRGLHFLEPEAVESLLLLATLVLDPSLHGARAGQQCATGGCPVEPALVAQVRGNTTTMQLGAYSSMLPSALGDCIAVCLRLYPTAGIAVSRLSSSLKLSCNYVKHLRMPPY